VLNTVFLTLDKPTKKPKKRKLKTKERLTKKRGKRTERLRQKIEVRISGKQKTCLEDI